MKELDLQKRIIDEVKAAGGWGRKWASSWQNGVPDLILILPATAEGFHGPMFVEVKLIERPEINFDRYKYPIKTTRLQVQELDSINRAGGIAFVLVGVLSKAQSRLYPALPGADYLDGTEPYTEWNRKRIRLDAVDLINDFVGKNFE